MIKISKKTLSDLEFGTVLQQLAQYCITDYGRQKALEIRPFISKEAIAHALYQVNEHQKHFSRGF